MAPPKLTKYVPPRAIIYVRLSSYRGDKVDPSTSPQRQEEVCRAYCQAKGWDVVEVIKDLDVSGSDKGLRLDRPGLHAIRALWREADIVIFAKLDRLARNVLDFRNFADEAKAVDVALVSVAESLDLTTPGGQFVATILAAFAEMEAATIAERTRAGIDGVKRLGRWAGGPTPYGYRAAPNPDGPGVVLVVEETEAAIIREAAGRILAGQSLYRVAADFNERGVPTRKGKSWAQRPLAYMLTNDHIVGRMRHRGEVLRDENGEPRELWEPVLEITTWHRVRAALSGIFNTGTARHPEYRPGGPAKRGPRTPRASRLLSGIVMCGGGCNGPMYSGGAGSGLKVYSCAARRKGHTCDGSTMVADRLDAHVVAEFLRHTGHMNVIEVVESETEAPRRTDLDAAIVQTAQAMTQRGADVMALAAQLQALQAERDAAPTESQRTTHVIDTGRTFAEVWAEREGDLAGQRALLLSAIARVTVRPSGSKGVRVRQIDFSRVDIDWHEHDPDLDPTD